MTKIEKIGWVLFFLIIIKVLASTEIETKSPAEAGLSFVQSQGNMDYLSSGTVI
jgi:hypothetical protein